MAENGYAKPVLITTEWLAEHLNETEWDNLVDVPIEKGS
jgi:hypothetical protein